MQYTLGAAKLVLIAAMAAVVCFQDQIVSRLSGMPGPDERLLVSIVSQDEAGVEQALDTHVSPTMRGHDGTTPLHYAAGTGNLHAVRRLLAAGADPNAQDMYGRTPLMCAAQSDNGAIVAHLLSRGADATIRDHKSRTASDYATAGGTRAADADVAALLAIRDRRPHIDGNLRGDTRPADTFALNLGKSVRHQR